MKSRRDDLVAVAGQRVLQDSRVAHSCTLVFRLRTDPEALIIDAPDANREIVRRAEHVAIVVVKIHPIHSTVAAPENPPETEMMSSYRKFVY